MPWDHTSITTREVDLGPVRLALVEAGRGGRPLLLAHGFTGTKEDFADWIDPLVEAGWWVVAPDHRGHGGSSKLADESAYTLATLAADLEALVAHLGWDRYALLGHSMGGMIAQEVVLRDPGRVERLVLMDTHHGPVEGLEPERVEAGMAILRSEGLEVFLSVLEHVAPRVPTPSEAALAARRPELVAWNETKLRNVDPTIRAVPSGCAHAPRPVTSRCKRSISTGRRGSRSIRASRARESAIRGRPLMQGPHCPADSPAR